MTDETESQPEESRASSETGEGREDREQKNLQDATLDPGALIEQSGDIRQAETTQESFTALVAEAGDLIGRQSKPAEGPFEQGSSGGDNGGDEATPINLPAPELISLISEDGTLRAVTHSENESLAGSLPEVRGDLDQVTVTGTDSAGGLEATSITLPGARGTASEQAATEERAVEQAPVEYPSEPPPPPPDMESRGAETGAGPEGEGARVMSAIPLGGEETGTTTETPEAGPEPSEQPDQAPVESEIATGAEADLDTVAAGMDENVEGEMNEEALAEAEEGWNPPDVYAHVDSSGKVTIVDAEGKPIDCPPTVSKVIGDDGKEKYLASYQTGGKTYSFEVTAYISTLSDLYVGYDQNGKLTVFNGNGEPVDSPPVITKFVDNKGMEQYTVYYPGAGPDSGVVLGAYMGSLQDCYSHIGPDGMVTIVDADGNPLKCQPTTTKYIDNQGVEQVVAYYPGAGEAGKITLSSYTASLQDCYVNFGQDGKVTIVDADGNPLKCQPATTKYIDNKGVEQVVAYYPGAGEAGKVTLSSYSTSLQNCYANYGQDGKVTIVGADGKPLASQPLTYKFVDDKGVEQIVAYYAGTGDSGKITLSSYSTSLQNCYSHIGQDGKITIVGADGKPLASQPLTYKFVDNKGLEHIIAYYAGDKSKTTLTSYLPPSGKSKSSGSI